MTSRSRKAKEQKENTDDLRAEIARLTEEVRLLRIENEFLRQKTPQLNGAVSSLKNGTPARKILADVNSPQSKGCNCKGSCARKNCGCVKKEIPCGALCKCTERCKNQENEDKENPGPSQRTVPEGNSSVTEVTPNRCSYAKSNFTANPMEPSRTLLRTPPSRYLPPLHLEPEPPNPPLMKQEVEVPLPSHLNDVKESEVDWDAHQARLVPCRLCRRKFNPDRLQKHEAHCKNV